MSRAWLIAIAIASACHASSVGSQLVEPGDGGGDGQGTGGSNDGGTGSDGGPVDTPPEPGTLAEACGGTAPVTLDDWENCYRKRKCEWEVGCVSLDRFRDVADCLASTDAFEGGRLVAERRERKRAVEQGRASINVAAFTQCLLRTGPARCNTALYDPACLTRFTGMIGDGAACYTNVECASPDAVCNADCTDACCVGTCQRKFREGEDCLLFESCEPGLRCTGTRCVSGDAGTACARGSVNQCDFGTFCDRQTLRCTPTLPSGSSCTSLLQCGGDNTCVGLSITNSNPGRCVRVSQPGDPCDDFCFGNLFCDRAVGMCRRLPTLGQGCSVVIPCAGANTICNNGVCVARSDIGVSCSGQTCLPGLFCTSELGDAAPKCAARRAVGGVCAAPGHCESYLCSGNASQPGVCLPWSNTCP